MLATMPAIDRVGYTTILDGHRNRLALILGKELAEEMPSVAANVSYIANRPIDYTHTAPIKVIRDLT